MAEKSITGAARKVGVTPSAMSHALHRLRHIIKDELMERTGHGMVPTQCALELAQPVHAALQQLQKAVDQQLAFDPKTSERSFTLRIAPYLADSLLPRLCARVQSEAPTMLLMIEFPKEYGPGFDNPGDLLLRVCTEDWGAEYRQQRMLRNRFMVAMRRGHPSAGSEMTLDLFLSLRHLIVGGIGVPVIDNRLATDGRSRAIALTLPSLSAVIPVLEQTDLCTLLPEQWIRLNCEPGRLATAPVPVPGFAFTVDMIWRSQDDDDAGLRWLRRLIVEEFADIYESWAEPLDLASDDSPDRPERRSLLTMNGVIFDQTGRKFSVTPPLGDVPERLDPFDHAVRTFGHIHVRPIRGGLMVEFDPRVASRLAVIAAFYELGDRAPDRIVLVCRGVVHRFEVLCSPGEACRRIEELIGE